MKPLSSPDGVESKTALPEKLPKLPDPARCPKCHRRGRVVDARERKGYIRRRHRCVPCRIYWLSYQTVVHPSDQIDGLLSSGVY